MVAFLCCERLLQFLYGMEFSSLQAESSILPTDHMMIGPAVTSLNHKIVDHSEYLEAQILKNIKVKSRKGPVKEIPKEKKVKI